MSQTRIVGYHSYVGEMNWEPIRIPSDKAQFDKFNVGWEWELESGGQSFSNARAICLALGYDLHNTDRIVVATDSSLTNGFEIVGPPGNYAFHMGIGEGSINITAACEKAAELDYTGEDGGHAGLHFNIDRSCFRNQGDIEEKFMLLLLNNKDWMFDEFSRRRGTRNQWSYCPFPSDDISKLTPMSFRRDYDASVRRLLAMSRASDRHCTAINLSKQNIIEARFIASTTYPKYFLGSIQLIFMMCWAVDNLSLEELSCVRFPWFRQVARGAGLTQFIETCEQRRIGVTVERFPL